MIGPNYSDRATTWQTVVLRKVRGPSDAPPGQIDKPVITPEIVETSCAISLSASANPTYTTYTEDHALFLREQAAKKQIAQLQASLAHAQYYRQYRQYS